MYTLLVVLLFSTPLISGDHEDFTNFGNKILDKSVNMTLIHELAAMKAVEFIEHFGYPCETHNVTTKDGYVLTIHRVPHGKDEDGGSKTKPIVLLLHGIFQSSKDWFASGPTKSLGFLLADAGYDVWAANTRGNVYSRNHTVIDPDHKNFWNFTFHDSGVNDIPAIIDFILDHQKQKQLIYVGYSQGTTVLYTMLSELPEYNEKIKVAFTMAPVAYVKHIRGDAQLVFDKYDTLLEIGEMFGFHEVSSSNPVANLVTRKVCELNYFRHLCIKSMFELIGYDVGEFNVTLLPIVFYYYPSGSSLKNVMHFYQEYKSGEFQRYDYGSDLNHEFYGSPDPPKYNLNNVRANIHLIYSLNDYISSEVDVERLYAELPEGNKQKYLVPNEQWNHMDYIMGINADKVIYKYILDELAKLGSPKKIHRRKNT